MPCLFSFLFIHSFIWFSFYLFFFLSYDQKYSPEELDAAYALLALSNSAPSPPSGYHGYKAKVIDPGVNLQTENGGKRPNSSEVVHQVPQQPLNSQMPSPLAELNSFVAAALPVGDERYVYNQYTASQPVSFITSLIKYSVF